LKHSYSVIRKKTDIYPLKGTPWDIPYNYFSIRIFRTDHTSVNRLYTTYMYNYYKHVCTETRKYQYIFQGIQGDPINTNFKTINVFENSYLHNFEKLFLKNILFLFFIFYFLKTTCILNFLFKGRIFFWSKYVSV